MKRALQLFETGRGILERGASKEDAKKMFSAKNWATQTDQWIKSAQRLTPENWESIVFAAVGYAMSMPDPAILSQTVQTIDDDSAEMYNNFSDSEDA